VSEFHSTCKAIHEKVTLGSSQDKPAPSSKQIEESETALVRDVLQQDGYSKSDPFFHQAMYLCTLPKQRREFLRMTSSEGGHQYVQMVWPLMHLWRPNRRQLKQNLMSLWNCTCISNNEVLLAFNSVAFVRL
jgi:hypothetical protein